MMEVPAVVRLCRIPHTKCSLREPPVVNITVQARSVHPLAFLPRFHNYPEKPSHARTHDVRLSAMSTHVISRSLKQSISRTSSRLNRFYDALSLFCVDVEPLCGHATRNQTVPRIEREERSPLTLNGPIMDH
ncbi:hypothetical protein CC2G_003282 [Coprinopsis cinerea AmutBmut pab1-1]|nr:hypothetical protein CC2G_003282 [Coprinopsis cinerea AmutBmut pab1-1]